MNGDYLLDTNALINILKTDNFTLKINYGKFFISIISEMEYLCYPNITENEEKLLKKIINEEVVINIDNGIKEKVINLKRNNKIKLPDAII